MDSTASIDHPLAIVTQRLFEDEPSERQQEIAREVIAFYENGRDDVFFSIADQMLTKAVTQKIESHLKKLIALSEERSVNGFSFEFEIA
ncbi:hypothetical protein [Thauera sinica]|uniref:Uncharacterized protein n=1 Tax=Thauera sinica TaxID=2665146 RepID=A0ABW1ASW7_9RHOO|nr:hypothetical protein [Thauera sp. K11]ATE61481.1 hypothetical protein CCZ27_17335 [Thauera sp. K11]